MKSETGCKSVPRDEARNNSKSGAPPPPQLNLDPEKRRDFFNKLLEKYSTKSTKLANSDNPSSINQNLNQSNTKFPFIPLKSAPKCREKLSRKKKLYLDRCMVKVMTAGDTDGNGLDELWKNKIKYHSYDRNVYKNHTRMRNTFPFPLPKIEEKSEQCCSEDSSLEEWKDGDEGAKSIDHSFTFLPSSGDQDRHKSKQGLIMHYEEKTNLKNLPEELKPRHITKTPSGSMIWAGNDIVNSLLRSKVSKKKNKNHLGGDEPSDKELKSSKMKSQDDLKLANENEDRQCKTLVKIKKTKSKKTTAVLELDDKHKQSSSAETRQITPKPSSSSLPHLGIEENNKTGKKTNEKSKKPKKLIKKQTFTLVTTSKPS